jgi:hypothetical protein
MYVCICGYVIYLYAYVCVYVCMYVCIAKRQDTHEGALELQRYIHTHYIHVYVCMCMCVPHAS